MQMPFQFPDWMPWWAQLIIVVGAILLALAYLALPFSVFGTKSRLDAIEARLDEIQGEIRSLSLRLPEPDQTGYDAPALIRAAAAAPIPPRPTLRAAARLSEARERAEPQLGRFRETR